MLELLTFTSFFKLETLYKKETIWLKLFLLIISFCSTGNEQQWQFAHRFHMKTNMNLSFMYAVLKSRRFLIITVITAGLHVELLALIYF